MITRIEIDGFKTFDGFALDLRPFTAVVGPNASGKSNLFDAIKFVSRLAQVWRGRCSIWVSWNASGLDTVIHVRA